MGDWGADAAPEARRAGYLAPAYSRRWSEHCIRFVGQAMTAIH